MNEWLQYHRSAKRRIVRAGKGGTEEFDELMCKPFSKMTDADKEKVRTKLTIKQDGKCGICGIPQDQLGRRISIDRNHNTDRVRGLLCNNCNTGIGMFKSDIHHTDQLQAAIRYLDNE